MSNKLEQKQYGFFRGIVIQNNDPERRGRVKIFLPEQAPYLAKQLGLPEEVLHARFAGGKNIDTFLSKEVLEKLKLVLHWSEQASPLMGSGTSGLYDAKNDIATVSDGYSGNAFETIGGESITPSGESVSPKAIHSIHAIPGGFGEGYKTGRCDLHNECLAPTAFNNATKGMFSIPRVGAQVWIFFENGDLAYPVYFGYVFDKNDWHTIYNPQDGNPDPHYPGAAENISDDGEPYFHTGKTVFNSKAGSLEFIDTDDFEKIKLSHYSGSLLEFGNNYSTEVHTGKKTTIVNENEFHTVKGDKSIRVNGELHERYEGNHYVTHGDPDNKFLYEQWMDTAGPAFAQAALFAERTRIIKDPTLDGSSKGGPNKKYTHPNRLTLKPETNWTNHLRQLNPNTYKNLDQIKTLGVSQI